MGHQLNETQQAKLAAFARRLIDQRRARIVVSPYEPESGFWFGGGNMIEGEKGDLYLVGRYRNRGDSRAGLEKGDRGLELAVFHSRDRGRSFEKILQFSKADLTVGDREVLSIEGSALHWTDEGVELFVSTEKANIGYPAGFESYLKPGTGVWTIERLQADTISGLKHAPIETALQLRDPQWIHVKDPFVYETLAGDLVLLFCTHPYSWSSSNTGFAVRHREEAKLGPCELDFFPRGFTWDVAMTRGTCVIDVPRVGPFAERQVSLMFYDGGECLRNHDEHAATVSRPRGYSCEEIGGMACVVDRQWNKIARLSRCQPWFVSPYGTGCSRYVDVHCASGGYFATWQQSQVDRSQPLVMNFVSHEEALEILE